MVITIDGFSATGKSTMAKLLAEKIGYIHINSGLLYRYVSYILLENNISEDEILKQTQSFINFLNEIKFDFSIINSLNLKTPEIDILGAKIAKIGIVRKLINKKIIEISKQNNIVIDGRDTGTHLFPEAKIKFFFIADLDIRAKRMSIELGEKNIELLKQRIKKRDLEDTTRDIAPLRKAKDAITIDTSNLTVMEILTIMECYINAKRESYISTTTKHN